MRKYTYCITGMDTEVFLFAKGKIYDSVLADIYARTRNIRTIGIESMPEADLETVYELSDAEFKLISDGAQRHVLNNYTNLI